MEKEQSPRLNTVIQDPFCYNNYTTSLAGTVELKKDALIGYGSKKCIKTLNRTNIPAQQQWPLVPVNVFIPNPPQKSDSPQTYTNWTLQTPLIITQEINDFTELQINTEKEKIIAKYGAHNQKALSTLNLLAEQLKKCAKNHRPYILPTLMPVHMLLSHHIQVNFFNCCQTTLTFTEHDKLEKLLTDFMNCPQVSFTLFGAKTTRRIQLSETMTRGNDVRLANAHRQQTNNTVSLLTKKTNQELKENGIIISEYPKISSENYNFLAPNIGVATINNCTHGENGCSRDTFRNLLLTNELNNRNPVRFLNARAMTGKK
jgi:hypothetical protein